MKRWTVWIVAGALALGGLACSRGTEDVASGGEAGPAESAVSAHKAETVNWEKTWQKAVARAKKESKPILVDFYADWCVWCKTLDSTTYRDPAVVRMLDESMVPLKIDVDHGGRDLARKWGVSGLPTILVLGPDGKELGRIPGYLPAKDFLAEVRGFTGGKTS